MDTTTTNRPTVAALKRTLVPGTRWAVMNHYITRDGVPTDHPCYGLRAREVVTASTVGFTLTMHGRGDVSHTAWPKAAQVREVSAERVVVDGPDGSPFLELVPIPPDALAPEGLRLCDGCGRLEDAGTYPDQDGLGRSVCCAEPPEVTSELSTPYGPPTSSATITPLTPYRLTCGHTAEVPGPHGATTGRAWCNKCDESVAVAP